MLGNQLKAALALVATVLVPISLRADQSMNANQTVQPFTAGETVRAGQLPAGYNQSASYVCDGGWDVMLTGDYIYWKWQQDNLQVGMVVPPGAEAGGRTLVGQNPGYKSGFQVGLGFSMPGMDDWSFYSEYTWYRNTTDLSYEVPVGSYMVPAKSGVGFSDATQGATFLSGTVTNQTKFTYDLADFMLDRPFYFGKKLTANFGAGLRAFWLSQQFTTTVSNATVVLPSLSNPVPTTAIDFTNGYGYQKVSSWALGPKMMLDANWIFGYGFKMLSNISTSVLYTRYDLSGNGSGDIDGISVGTASFANNGYGTLRAMTDMFLGLGWGSYFCDNSFHFDLTAGYDFNVLWNYGLNIVDNTQVGNNIYIQGLNIQARFDF